MTHGSESYCNSCGTRAEYVVITVSLPLPAEQFNRYFCPVCSLIVELPQAVEGRFVLQLDDNQTDLFGNPSWFRSQLATEVKRFARPDRAYALTEIPRMQIHCPDDESPMEPWIDYPSPRLLHCRKCRRRSVPMGGASWISGSVIAPW